MIVKRFFTVVALVFALGANASDYFESNGLRYQMSFTGLYQFVNNLRQENPDKYGYLMDEVVAAHNRAANRKTSATTLLIVGLSASGLLLMGGLIKSVGDSWDPDTGEFEDTDGDGDAYYIAGVAVGLLSWGIYAYMSGESGDVEKFLKQHKLAQNKLSTTLFVVDNKIAPGVQISFSF